MLKLGFRKITLKEEDSPAYIAVRQQHHRFVSAVSLNTANLTEGRRAGIALVQSNEYHLRVEVCREEKEQLRADVILCKAGEDSVVSRAVIPVAGETVGLILTVDGLKASVELEFETKNSDGREKALICGDLDIRALSTEVAGGFVGCTVGMYAVADEDNHGEAACFGSFSYLAV